MEIGKEKRYPSGSRRTVNHTIPKCSLSHYLSTMPPNIKCISNVTLECRGCLPERKQSKTNGVSSIWSPKEKGQICIIADIHQMNKILKQREYHIPAINKMLSCINRFTCTTEIDLNMGYMTLSLNTHARFILQIIFPFGIFEYQVLHMGMKPVADIFQARMTSLFPFMQDDSPIFYIGDILIYSNTLNTYIVICNKVHRQDTEARLQVNEEKSEWCKQDIEFLGLTTTVTGYKPMWSMV